MTNSPPKCFCLSRRFRGKVGADKGLDAPDKGLDAPNNGLDTPDKGLDAPDNGLDAPDKGLGAPDNGLGAPDKGLDAADNDLESMVMASGVSSAGLRFGVRFRRLTTSSSATAEAGAAHARAQVAGGEGGRKHGL